MLDTELRSLVQSFRARAREILLRAETMHNAEARVKMREIAAGYERLAQRDPRKVVSANPFGSLLFSIHHLLV